MGHVGRVVEVEVVCGGVGRRERAGINRLALFDRTMSYPVLVVTSTYM